MEVTGSPRTAVTPLLPGAHGDVGGRLDPVTAARSGLSATGYGHRKHRASNAPVRMRAVSSRPAEIRRRHIRALLAMALLALLVASITGWRLSQAPSTGPERISTTSGSSVTRSHVDIGNAGELHVVMDIHFAAAVQELAVQVPTDAGAGAAFQPRVTLVGLEADGSRVPLEQTLGPGDLGVLPLASAAERVGLEYNATGTFVASTPSTPGRGLVLLTPLTVAGDQSLSMVEVVDARVLNLGCAGAEELTACGSRSGSRWIAGPATEAEQVIAQVDLERQ